MKNYITIKNGLIYLFVFVLGAVVMQIIKNSQLGENIEFSTSGLLLFVFSIVFAVVSIALAITAIHLGKSSEKIIIDRSDKGIELQNGVHIKTLEVLSKIESSIGVTEKRVEDIRSHVFNVDSLSKTVVNQLISGSAFKVKDEKKAEKELADVLIKELVTSEKWSDDENRVLKINKDGGISSLGVENVEYVESCLLNFEAEQGERGISTSIKNNELIDKNKSWDSKHDGIYSGKYCILSYNDDSCVLSKIKSNTENTLVFTQPVKIDNSSTQIEYIIVDRLPQIDGDNIYFIVCDISKEHGVLILPELKPINQGLSIDIFTKEGFPSNKSLFVVTEIEGNEVYTSNNKFIEVKGVGKSLRLVQDFQRWHLVKHETIKYNK